MYVCMYVCMHACMYVCMYVCILYIDTSLGVEGSVDARRTCHFRSALGANAVSTHCQWAKSLHHQKFWGEKIGLRSTLAHENQAKMAWSYFWLKITVCTYILMCVKRLLFVYVCGRFSYLCVFVKPAIFVYIREPFSFWPTFCEDFGFGVTFLLMYAHVRHIRPYTIHSERNGFVVFMGSNPLPTPKGSRIHTNRAFTYIDAYAHTQFIANEMVSWFS